MSIPFIRTRIISLEKRCYKWYNLIKYEVSYVQQRHVRAWQQAFVHKRIVRVRQKRANEVGAENVFDFSLGNPNVPAPDCVKTLLSSLQTLAKPFTATLRRKATLPSEKRLQRIFLAVSA